MFSLFCKKAFCLIFILVLAGCFASSSVDGGFEPDETLFLDEDYEFNTSLEKGEILAFDARIPLNKGYTIVGASFDPQMVRLEHYLEYDEDGSQRIRYIFTTILDGTSAILIKMQKTSGGDIEVYKHITVNVGEDDGLF